MSALSRRTFLQSSAAIAGAAAVAGSAGRATAAERATAPAAKLPADSTPAGDAKAAPAGPVIVYVDGSTVTVLRGEREVTRTDADLARRIARAADKED